MLQFLKYFFAALLALVVFFFFFFIILIGIGISASKTSEVAIKDNSILKIDFNEQVTDEYGEDPFEDLNIPGFQMETRLSLPLLKKAIRAAITDPKIKGIYLPVEYVSAGPAVMLEIRDELKKFKAAGKFIVAYGEVFSESAYFINSVADSVYLLPTGYMEVNGLFSETVFFSGFLEKIGVKPEIFKVGDFKSFVEPFERKEMSEPNRIQTTAFLNSIYQVFLNEVASSRKLKPEELERISDSMLVRSANDAVNMKLVDRLAYYDQVEKTLHTLSELDSADEVRFVSTNKYLKSIKSDSKNSKNRIAIIVAEGDIVSSTEDDASMSAKDISEEISKARKDEKVKAIVLRVNSPGGSAIASDLVWREVILTKGVKPIIASMSTVAASGGYYIAMACDTIVAQPNTITGSIGVFGIFFNVKELINDKLGVFSDGVKTGEFSDLGNPARAFSPYERQMIQTEIDEIYRDFTTKASEARKMPLEELLAVASGRVWSGTDAKERKLVDVLGNLDTAVAIAANSANLGTDYSIRYYPQQKNFFEKIFSNMETEVKTGMLKKELGEWYPMYQKINSIKSWEGIQARMPIEVDFH